MKVEQRAQGSRCNEEPAGDFDGPKMTLADFAAERGQGEGTVRVKDRNGFGQCERLVIAPVVRMGLKTRARRAVVEARARGWLIVHVASPSWAPAQRARALSNQPVRVSTS